MRLLFIVIVILRLNRALCKAADNITDFKISEEQSRIIQFTAESNQSLIQDRITYKEFQCDPVFVSPATAPGQSVLLMLSNRGDQEARVRVSVALSEVIVPSLGYTSVVLPRPERSMDGVLSAALTCVQKPEGIDVSTIHLGSCAAYLKLPTSSVGSQYEVITWNSESPKAEHIISITVSSVDVHVEIKFPPGKCKILYKGSYFLCGDVVSITIEALHTVFFTSSASLTGTFITSNQGPISVFAGSSNLTVGPSSVSDQTISELLPLSLWGIRYALPSIPENDGAGYSVAITSGSRKAGVTIDRVSYMVQPGDPLILISTGNKPMYIVADAPIQVMQFVRGALNESDSGAPASIVIPPLEQYSTTYSFTNPPGYTHYLMIIIDSKALGVDNNNMQTDLLLGGAVVDGNSWKSISGTSLVTRNIKLTVEGYSQIEHKRGRGFGAFRYSFERGNCAYAFPAGIKAATPRSPQAAAAQVAGVSSSPVPSLPASSFIFTNFPTNFSPDFTFPSAGSTPGLSATPDLIKPQAVTTDFTKFSDGDGSTPQLTTGSGSSFSTSSPIRNQVASSTRPVTHFTSFTEENSKGSTDFSSSHKDSSAIPTSFPTLPSRKATSFTSPGTVWSNPSSSAPWMTTVRTLPTEPSVGCRSDNLGLNFLVAFMENLQSGSYNLEVYPTTFSGLPNITVEVSTPLATSSEGKAPSARNLSEEFLLTSGQMHIVNVPSYLELVGIERAAKAVQVLSTERIGVYGMNSVNGSCDGFLAFPVSSLGTEYYSMAYFPPNHKSQIGLIATHNNTLVNITLRLATRPGFNLKWDGKVYTNGDTISVKMNEYETVQIQDNTDLSGTRIISNYPVAVFSGNDYSQITSDVTDFSNPSHLVDQIPSIDYWGYTFYTVPIPQSQAGFLLKVVSAYPSTTVSVLDSTGVAPVSFTLLQPGDFRKSTYQSGVFVRITSSRPLLVGLFAGSSEESHPAMMILPPAELYKSWYTFSTGHSVFSNFSHFVIVVIDRSALPGLTINGDVVDQGGWTLFPDEVEKVGKAINISSGVHLIRQMNDIPFGAYVYGHSSGQCAYAYPAGLCLGSADSTAAPMTTSYSTLSSQSSTSGTQTTTSTNHGPSPPNITDCSCLTLTSSLQPTYRGFYYRSARQYDGFPYYQSYDCDFYIYVSRKSKSWLVGPDLGGSKGAILALSSQFIPFPNITRWSAYSTVNHSFIVDASTKVECSCPATSVCQSVEILNTTSGLSYFDGIFERQPTTRDGRPVFKHESGDLYLFYVGPSQNSTSCQYWTVSQNPDSQSGGVMRLYNRLQDPAAFNSHNSIWLEYDSAAKTFKERTNLRLECYLPSVES